MEKNNFENEKDLDINCDIKIETDERLINSYDLNSFSFLKINEERSNDFREEEVRPYDLNQFAE